MRLRIFAVAALAALALAGCKVKGPRSPAYEQAQDEFNQLYGRYLEDAYLRPEMDELEAKLKTVPDNSLDGRRALELRRRIVSGRERMQAVMAERKKMAEDALKPPPDFEFSDRDAPVDAGMAEADPDAGAPEHPVAGMPIDEMVRRFGDCFVPDEDIEVKGHGYRPTWGLRETAYCLQHHPGYDQKIVFQEGEKVLFIGSRSKLETITSDAGTP